MVEVIPWLSMLSTPCLLPLLRIWFQSLVGELRPPKQHGQKKEKETYGKYFLKVNCLFQGIRYFLKQEKIKKQNRKLIKRDLGKLGENEPLYLKDNIRMRDGMYTDCTELPRQLSGKDSACQRRRQGFHPGMGKILRRKKWQPTPVFLPGESHGQRRLAGYSPQGYKELDTTE